MMAIKRSTCLTANRSRCFSLASQRRMNDTQTVFHHFNFAVTIRSPWRRSSSPSLRPTRIRVAAFRKFPLRISRFRYSTQATPAFSFPLPFYQAFTNFYEISSSTFSSYSRTARFSSQHANQRYGDIRIYPNFLGLPTNPRDSESYLIAYVDAERRRRDGSESERRFSCLTAGFCTRVALVYTTIKCLHLCLS